MVSGRLVVMRSSSGASEDWGEFAFVALPSPGDRIMARRDGIENYATVLAIHHAPALAGSEDVPTIEVVARWTGAGGKLR
ncbi:hypothetical protein [Tsuneonella amylolytica]|uniref:hypothetical protein n=1 Tax=Tsuneonella amylolytica TaxID=2338327 RepID=UPI000EA9E235|nr:hypothetical protein [Tsuneonella amylolytica]